MGVDGGKTSRRVVTVKDRAEFEGERVAPAHKYFTLLGCALLHICVVVLVCSMTPTTC